MNSEKEKNKSRLLLGVVVETMEQFTCAAWGPCSARHCVLTGRGILEEAEPALEAGRGLGWVGARHPADRDGFIASSSMLADGLYK